MKGHFANPRVHNVRLGGQAVLVGAGRFRPAEQLNLDRFNVNAVIIGFRAYLDSMDRSNWPELQVKFHASNYEASVGCHYEVPNSESEPKELRSCGCSKRD